MEKDAGAGSVSERRGESFKKATGGAKVNNKGAQARLYSYLYLVTYVHSTTQASSRYRRSWGSDSQASSSESCAFNSAGLGQGKMTLSDRNVLSHATSDKHVPSDTVQTRNGVMEHAVYCTRSIRLPRRLILSFHR